jgi:glycosyltransferase involved in cell wall biosynthesis
VNAPDLQRVRQSLPYYAEFGWAAHVLAVAPDPTAQVLDPALAAALPPEIPVTRVKPLPLPATSWAGLRNLGWRSLLALARAGNRLLAPGGFDLVFFSTTQFACLPLGRYWLARYGVPFVIDLQDPWVNDYYERNPSAPRPGGVKFRFARAAAALSEGKTLAACAGLITVSPAYVEVLRQRYDFMATKPAVTLPFGIDPTDFARAAQLAASGRLFAAQPGRLHVVSVGRGGPDLHPALRAVLASAEIARSAAAAAGAAEPSLEFHLVGTSYAAQSAATPQFAAVIAAAGAADFCHEHSARIGYFDALRLLREADVILVLGSADASYSPSKLHTALAAGKPVLAVVWRGSELSRQVAPLAGIRVLELEPDGSAVPAALEAAAQFWRDLVASPARTSPGVLPPEMHARALTAQQAAFFSRVLSPDPTPHA